MAILPSSGFAANGKLILDWDGAAAQLTRTGNTWAFGLGQPVSVTYAFRSTAPSTMPSGVTGFQPFNSAQIIAAETALQLWADVANITFVRVGSGTTGPGTYSNSATMLFSNYTTETDPASAFAYLPTPGATSAGNSAGDIWVDASQPENVSPVYGDFGPHVLAHEIGHAIGINHPGEYDGGSPTYDADADYWQDARMFTVMSYFGSANTGGVIPTFSWGPQYHDIAAAQRLYGPNMSTRTGDTTYGFNNNSGRTLFDISSAAQGVTFSIWDAGGVDMLDLSGYSENADIDLRPGAFSSAGPTDDRGPAKYNISIAVGALIENAIGGAGHDTLTGNYANNSLVGNNGNDVLIGGAGADTMNGGAGVDTASYADATAGVVVKIWAGAGTGDLAQGDVLVNIENLVGSAFNDRLIGIFNHDNVLSGGGGDDYMDGLGGIDTLYGEAGNDRLLGGAGGDYIDGGAGNIDIATYSTSPAGVTIILFDGTATGGDAQGDTLVGVEGTIGSAFGDNLIGNGGFNVLQGNDGNDRLDGVTGWDFINGGAGNDTIIGGDGNDTLKGAAGGDVFEFYANAGVDRIDDFEGGAGAGDVIGLIGLGPLFDSFAEVMAATSQQGANAVIDLGGGNSITLIAVQALLLDADDFVFG